MQTVLIAIKISKKIGKFIRNFIKNELIYGKSMNSVLSEEDSQSVLLKVPNFRFSSTRSGQKLVLNRLKQPYVCYFRTQRSPT